MTDLPVLEAGAESSITDPASPRSVRPVIDFSHIADPSVHFLVDPPRLRVKFRNWFLVAVFAGVLMALAMVAIMNV